MIELINRQQSLTISQWKIFAAVILSIMLDFFAFPLIGFVLAFVVRDWHLTYGQSALILFSSGVAAVPGAIFFGWLGTSRPPQGLHDHGPDFFVGHWCHGADARSRMGLPDRDAVHRGGWSCRRRRGGYCLACRSLCRLRNAAGSAGCRSPWCRARGCWPRPLPPISAVSSPGEGSSRSSSQCLSSPKDGRRRPCSRHSGCDDLRSNRERRRSRLTVPDDLRPRLRAARDADHWLAAITLSHVQCYVPRNTTRASTAFTP
jgi:hypothetical protein